MRVTIQVPTSFRLRSVILSHGWSALEPFRPIPGKAGISLAIQLSGGKAALLSCTQSGKQLQVDIEGMPNVSEREREEIRRIVTAIFRTDEDLTELYAMARKDRRLSWIVPIGAGRIMRAASAFEDTVKMICTTNCSWALTTIMVARLTRLLGTRVGDRHAFPTATEMAGHGERFYRNEIKAGYRSPFLLELAQRVAAGEVKIENVRNEALSESEKIELFSDIMGVGPYALGNLLRLHSVYDRFAHDSWITAEYARMYHKGRKVTERTIERRYTKYGSWQGLVYWLDLTKRWYTGRNGFETEVEP